MAERGEGGVDDVADEDVVARLPPVAEDFRRPAAGETTHEDRDDAGLAVWILARSVHVAVAKRDVRRLVEPVVGRQVLLAGELRGAVRGERPPLRILGRRRVALAVDRTARRGEDHLRAVAPRRLEHAQRPEHVHVGVVDRILDGDAHVRLRREVEARLRPDLVEDGVRVGADVALVEARALGHILAAAVAQVVEDVHLVAARDQRVGHVRADEPCAAGDDGPHRLILSSRCS